MVSHLFDDQPGCPVCSDDSSMINWQVLRCDSSVVGNCDALPLTGPGACRPIDHGVPDGTPGPERRRIELPRSHRRGCDVSRRAALFGGVFLGGLLGCTGCGVPLGPPLGEAPVNTCSTAGDCATGGTCDQGKCVATSYDLAGLLLQVRPQRRCDLRRGIVVRRRSRRRERPRSPRTAAGDAPFLTGVDVKPLPAGLHPARPRSRSTHPRSSRRAAPCRMAPCPRRSRSTASRLRRACPFAAVQASTTTVTGPNVLVRRRSGERPGRSIATTSTSSRSR